MASPRDAQITDPRYRSKPFSKQIAAAFAGKGRGKLKVETLRAETSWPTGWDWAHISEHRVHRPSGEVLLFVKIMASEKDRQYRGQCLVSTPSGARILTINTPTQSSPDAVLRDILSEAL